MSIAGKILYHAWYRPTGALCDCLANGGPWQIRKTEQGRREMEKAARALPSLPPCSGQPVELHVLTGNRFWYQTAFCLWSFAHQAQRPIRPVLYDDGTLAPDQAEQITNLFPETKVETRAAIRARLDKALGADRHPSLRARLLEYPILGKLTNIHAGSTGWKLVIDSDLLFFRRPTVLIDWCDHPDQPLRAEDLANAYGYPLPLLNELAGQPVPERVNTGLLGLRSESIDWARMEFWCRELLARGGTQYYQEQALIALLLAGVKCAVPPPSDYVLRPLPPEAIDCRAIMHHYVAQSKRWYFQNAWQTALKR